MGRPLERPRRQADPLQGAGPNVSPGKTSHKNGHTRLKPASQPNLMAPKEVRAVADTDQPRYPIFLPSSEPKRGLRSAVDSSLLARQGHTRTNSYQNAMMDPRLSQVLPGLTCSDCGVQIRLDQLGVHVCANAPPLPSFSHAMHAMSNADTRTNAGVAGIGAIGRRSTDISQFHHHNDCRMALGQSTPSPRIKRQLPRRPRSPADHTKESCSAHDHERTAPSSCGSVSSTSSNRSPESKLPFFEKYRQMLRTSPTESTKPGLIPGSHSQKSSFEDAVSACPETPQCASFQTNKETHSSLTRVNNRREASQMSSSSSSGTSNFSLDNHITSHAHEMSPASSVQASPFNSVDSLPKVTKPAQIWNRPHHEKDDALQSDTIRGQVASSATLDGLLADLELEMKVPGAGSRPQNQADKARGPEPAKPDPDARGSDLTLCDDPFVCREAMTSRKAPLNKGCQRCLLPLSLQSVHIPQLLGDQRWHPHCFRCTSCGNGFPDGVFYALGNLPYCAYHYAVESGTLCTQCRNPIEGTCVEIKDNPTLQSDGELQRFHRTCFTCQGRHCGILLGESYYQAGKARFCETSQCLRECEIVMQRIQKIPSSDASRRHLQGGPTARVEKRSTRLVNV